MLLGKYYQNGGYRPWMTVDVRDDAVPREGAALALEGYVVVALGHAGHSDQLGLVALVAVLLAVNLAVKFEG